LASPGDKESPSKCGRVAAICISKKKGVPKSEIPSAQIIEGYGVEADAHGGDWHRQVSLLSIEQIETMRQKGLVVQPGSFAENITTVDFDLDSIRVGDFLKIGKSVLLEVTQIGKECHTRCAIYHKLGECIMPERGVFARVKRGGTIARGDEVTQA
jgi:MOSC domain-containing protein YiiM